MASSPPTARDTIAQLKNDIDTGKTGDKVAAGDPGLSPLGTDDEAAGRPPSSEQVRRAREQETALGVVATKADRTSKGGAFPILIMGAVIVAIALVVIVFFAVKG